MALAPMCQRAQPPRANVLHDAGRAAGDRVDMSAEQCHHRRAGASVRNVNHSKAGAGFNISIGTCIVP